MKPGYVLSMAALLVASGLPGQPTVALRFSDPETITADPTGLRTDTSAQKAAGPRYPLGAEERGISATPVVAFVIDTIGRVEFPTASFLNASPPEFRDAICVFLLDLRFEPFFVGDQKRRVLLVQAYDFNTSKNRDSTTLKAAAALATASQEEFAASPMSSVVAGLDDLPHCNPERVARILASGDAGPLSVVTEKFESADKWPRHEIYVLNRGTRLVRITEAGIQDCLNTKKCGLEKKDILIRPGEKRLVLRVEPEDAEKDWAYAFTYNSLVARR